METLSDKELIQRYLRGDNKALDSLIENYLKLIYNFVYKNIGSASDAEDVTQEVFVKVWKNIRKFDLNREFKPWVFQIAKNTSIDFLRKKKSIPFSRFENEKGQNPLVDNIKEKPLNLLENISNKNTVSSALGKLHESERKLINMKYSEGLNFREIAEKLGESINTIKSRYRRILLTMKRNIKK